VDRYEYYAWEVTDGVSKYGVVTRWRKKEKNNLK
jgi:hypothetical protein